MELLMYSKLSYTSVLIWMWMCITACNAQSGFADMFFQPIFHRPLSNFTPGVQVDPLSCNTQPLQTMLDYTIDNARRMARAGLEAVNSPDTRLFDIFFNDVERDIVRTAFHNAILVLLKRSSYPVVLSCSDITHKCAEQGIPSYIITTPFANHNDSLAPVMICAQNFNAYPDLPDPCSRDSAITLNNRMGSSKAQFLLHEIFHINYIAGPTIRQIDDYAYGAYGAHVLRAISDPLGLVSPENINRKPSENVDNYIVMAVWSYMSHVQRRRCPDKYPMFGLIDELTKQVVTPTDRTELRHLLFEGDSPDSADGTFVIKADDGTSQVAPANGPADVVVWTSPSNVTSAP